jgi:hypothetical protein
VSTNDAQPKPSQDDLEEQRLRMLKMRLEIEQLQQAKLNVQTQLFVSVLGVCAIVIGAAVTVARYLSGHG